MSDSFVRWIPGDPGFVPAADLRSRAAALLRRSLPGADEVRDEVTEDVAFVDAGANHEGIACPLCDAPLGIEWWHAAMDRAFEHRFASLAVTTPCCARATSLDELRYQWPQGFARYVLEARNPGVDSLPPEITRELAELLGCELRVIWAHY